MNRPYDLPTERSMGCAGDILKGDSMKRIRPFVLLAAVAVLVGTTTAENVTSSSDRALTEAEVAHVDALYDDLANALAADDESAVASIEGQLEASGVTFHTDEEVEERFPEAWEQVVGGDTQILAAGLPTVALPSSKNVKWSTASTTVTYKNKKYVVQHLTATPISGKSSSLVKTGTKVIKTKKDMKAGAVAALGVVVASGAASANPYANVAVTLYQAILAGVSGASKSTVISNVDATYVWTHLTTVKFSWVKRSGASNSTQTLTRVATRTSTRVDYILANVARKDGKSLATQYKGGKSLANSPTCYTVANTIPIRSFLVETGNTSCYAGSVKITGTNGKNVTTVTTPSPPGMLGIG